MTKCWGATPLDDGRTRFALWAAYTALLALGIYFFLFVLLLIPVLGLAVLLIPPEGDRWADEIHSDGEDTTRATPWVSADPRRMGTCTSSPLVTSSTRRLAPS